jgi:hypothetical protein
LPLHSAQKLASAKHPIKSKVFRIAIKGMNCNNAICAGNWLLWFYLNFEDGDTTINVGFLR